MSFREADPDEPDALEMVRGTNVMFAALMSADVDRRLVPSILVRGMLLDLKAWRNVSLADKLARIDEMAAYMRAAISADHMVAEFFGSER